MRNTANILYTAVAVLCCGALFSGCARDDDALGNRHEAAVQISVESRIVDETDGTPTEAERAIHTLRVYAFVDGKPAGHYYTDAVTGDPHTFFMDIAFYSDGEQTVDFYAVANEKAVELKRAPNSDTEGTTVTLTETTSEAVLNSLWFNNMPRAGLETNGLPMFCQLPSVKLDFRNVKTETPTASGHEGHMLLNYDPIGLKLQRPVGKIGVFAAKAAGETSALRVKGLSSLAKGVKVRNYLMPQSDETLKAVLSGGLDIPIAVIDGEVTATMAENAADEIRSNPANYTPVMAEPFYPFENPWKNGGNWNIPGDDAGQVLKIDYQFGEDEPRTGYVYMPAIERNHYYAVCCLMHNDGRISVEYLVEDWKNEEEYILDFAYPNYGNPIMPKDEFEQPEGGKKFPQPTVWFNSDANSEAGSYTFRFDIRGPVDLPWIPVMDNATSDDFEIEVYQENLDGSKVVKYRSGTDPDTGSPYANECRADADNPFYIKIRPLKFDNMGKTMGLGIAYREAWLPDDATNLAHSPLLLINGLTSSLSYEGSSYAEFVVIQQVAAPDADASADPTPDLP